MTGMTKFDLEERLIIFGVLISNLVEELPNTITGRYLAGQLIRSGLSPALNYGEAQGKEYRTLINDFRILNGTKKFEFLTSLLT